MLTPSSSILNLVVFAWCADAHHNSLRREKRLLMSELLSTYDHLGICFEKSTLQLLRSHWAQAYLAMLATAFPDRSKGVRAELLHARIEAYLEDMDRASIDLPRRGDAGKPVAAKDLCVEQWMRKNRWLALHPLETGETEYRLTSDAIEAMEVVEKLGSVEALLSSPRVEMIVRAIESTALMVNPDYEAGLLQRKSQLERAQRELDEYISNGGAGETPDSTVRASVANVMDLLRQVPSDMRRIEELLIDQGNRLLEDFRDDVRPPGEIVGDYLERSKNIFEATESGRVYSGAMETLSNAQLSGTISDDLKMIASASALEDMPAEERLEVRRAWSPVRSGVESVLRQRRKSSRTIRSSLTQHDIAKDRELARELRALEKLAWEWARAYKRGQRSPFSLEVGKAETESMARALFDPEGHRPPPALADHGEAEAADLRELIRRGGPKTRAVVKAIADSLPPTGEADVTGIFNSLDSGLRREVELCGLMQLATDIGIDVERETHGAYRTVSLDGRKHRWNAPEIKLSEETRQAFLLWKEEHDG